LAASAQADKALKAQAIQQLKFYLLVTEAMELLQNKDTHHEFGGVRWTTAFDSAGARCSLVDFGRQGGKVDMLFHDLQDVAQLVELGFTFFGGK
jgi:hypothetical protein